MFLLVLALCTRYGGFGVFFEQKHLSFFRDLFVKNVVTKKIHSKTLNNHNSPNTKTQNLLPSYTNVKETKQYIKCISPTPQTLIGMAYIQESIKGF